MSNFESKLNAFQFKIYQNLKFNITKIYSLSKVCNYKYVS